ncbi:hypothetical protein PR048_030428 [Dryococelus australis]|uniref:Uncharacterized protein n=1 Tax=Dryococelus australis TaxID=614101 RepID=A0ABQ9GBN1_9NEOP|nr:hypothetical protein PR048_030428 [Dryococelus australis]
MAQAMVVRKQGKLAATCKTRGKIIVKTTAESKPIQVKDNWLVDMHTMQEIESAWEQEFIEYKPDSPSDFSEHAELKNYSLWVEIANIGTLKKSYLGRYYRPPQFKQFALDHDLANSNKVDTFILGDFDINMWEQNNECTMYKVIYRSNGFNILNTLPTRINNSIYHVMNNTTKKNTIICNIENTMMKNLETNKECIAINYIKVANLLKTILCNLTVHNKDATPTNTRNISCGVKETTKHSKDIKALLNITENYKTQVESLITSDSKIITQEQFIANTFCKHFTNVVVKISNQIQS